MNCGLKYRDSNMRFISSVMHAGLITAVMAAVSILTFTPLHGDNKPRGDVNADKALVYIIQPGGSRRHLFAGQEWLGVAQKDAYFFTHLDPGEQFIWEEDARAFSVMYFTPGSTNYLELGAKQIAVLGMQQGEALLDQIRTYSTLNETDRGDSYKKLKKYRKARSRAAKAGLFEPCRFAVEKRAEYDRRVEDGDAAASNILGNLYWYGECVKRDYPTAISWYRDAAQKGHIGAAVTLGNIYYRGTNVSDDPAESAIWYRRAAEHGDLFSQRRLAEMYRQGHGVEQDMDKAIEWYRKAAEDSNDRWSLVQLEAIDPEIQQRKRIEDEAETRAAQEQEKRVEEQRQRIRKRRLARIGGKYGALGVGVRPLRREVKLEQPNRKKPEDDGDGWDSGVAYMLPPEIALGVVALGMVFNAVEKSLDSRLSDAEKERIEAATGALARLLSEESIAEGLTNHIVAAGRFPGENPLFTPDARGNASAGNDAGDTANKAGANTILEVETTGIGLMLADKRYRLSHFVMANRVRLLRRDDGIILKNRALCYASSNTPKFSAWAANEGALIREQLGAAYTHTAQTLLLILADEAYGTNSRNNELCERLLEKVEERRAALDETQR